MPYEFVRQLVSTLWGWGMSELLTAEELAMLLDDDVEMAAPTAHRGGARGAAHPQYMELISSLALQELLPLLGQAEHLVLNAEYKQRRFAFSLSFIEDSAGNLLPRLSPPLIQEVGDSQPREWRMPHPEDAWLLDGSGEPLPWQISNLSASGLLLDGQEEMPEPGTPFRALLRCQGDWKIRLRGQVIRRFVNAEGGHSCAIQLRLKRQAQQRLQHYLYHKHCEQGKLMPLDE